MQSDYLAIVTGGAQGIGLAITSALLEAGAKVSFLDISREAGIKTQKQLDEKYGSGKATFVQCDVTRKDELEKAFYEAKDKLGGLNVVCNNAGRNCPNNERTMWEQIVDLNVSACIHGSMLGLDLMKKSNGGSGGVIINTASTGGLAPLSTIEVYSTTKAAVIHYTRCVAMTSLAEDVRINCICPDGVDTAMLDDFVASLQEANQLGTDVFPLTAEDIDAAKLPPSAIGKEVVKLIQDETKNGKALVVSGVKGTYFHTFN